mgnify:CR=1 FL=1
MVPGPESPKPGWDTYHTHRPRSLPRIGSVHPGKKGTMRSMGRIAVRVFVILGVVASAASCGLVDTLLGTDLAGDGTPTKITGLQKAGVEYFSTAARDVVADGSYAYVATYTYDDVGGVAVVDIANPDAPNQVGQYFPSSSDYRLYAANIVMAGTNVYIDGGSGGRMFAKVNVSSPSSPSLVYQLSGSEAAYALIAEGTSLFYIAGGGMYMYDVSDTYAATYQSNFKPAEGNVFGGCAGDGLIYVRCDGATFRVLQPNTARTGVTELSRIPIDYNGTGNMVRSGDHVYLQLYAENDCSLLVINVASSSAPFVEGRLAVQRVGRIAVSQDCVFICTAGTIDLIDVGDPAEPALLTSFVDASISSVNGVSAAGDTLVIADGGGGAGKLRCYRMLK